MATLTVEDLVSRARQGDAPAVAAFRATAHYLGAGLAAVVNAVDPARIYVSGEITRPGTCSSPSCGPPSTSARSRPSRGRAEIVVVAAEELPRLRGAAALVAAPAFAAPVVA